MSREKHEKIFFSVEQNFMGRHHFYRRPHAIWHKDYIEVPLTKGLSAKIDFEDADRVLTRAWSAHYQGKIGSGVFRARSAGTCKKAKMAYMHRFILNPSNNMQVDHINGDPLDNRRSNLRIVTSQQNRLNTADRLNKKTGLPRGVKKTSSNTYGAYINYNKTSYYLGSFRTPEQAGKAYQEASNKFFGEYKRRVGVNLSKQCIAEIEAQL